MSADLGRAWQAALAAEYRAVYGYALLGPRLDPDRMALARAAQLAHADLRDATVAGLLAAGERPDPPAADYSLGAVRDGRAATALAIELEDDCAAAWRYLYSVAAASSGRLARDVRRAAQTALTASAVRATRWRTLDNPGRATTPFPGI